MGPRVDSGLEDLTRAVTTRELALEPLGEPIVGAIGHLATSFNSMSGQLRALMDPLSREQTSSRDVVMFAMARLAESQDGAAGQHLERICRYVDLVARGLGKLQCDIGEMWNESVRVTAARDRQGRYR